jgi:hypothetical protein
MSKRIKLGFEQRVAECDAEFAKNSKLLHRIHRRMHAELKKRYEACADVNAKKEINGDQRHCSNGLYPFDYCCAKNEENIKHKQSKIRERALHERENAVAWFKGRIADLRELQTKYEIKIDETMWDLYDLLEKLYDLEYDLMDANSPETFDTGDFSKRILQLEMGEITDRNGLESELNDAIQRTEETLKSYK